MTARRLMLLMCLAEVCGMAGFATFSALLPTFLASWRLSNTEAGWISGIFFAGYVVAVPVLVSLTDRVSPRRVYLASMVLTAVTSLAFAAAAQGFWSAFALRALAGVGLAGTYMPGLKILSDRLEGPAQARAVAFYTASFGIGVSLSFLAAGEITRALEWPAAFLFAAVAALVACLIVWGAIPRRHLSGPAIAPTSHLLDFRPVLRNRRAMAFVLAYTCHNWELFALRSWIVAFLAFSAGLHEGAGAWVSATVIAALMNLMGWPASVIGNELATRFGRLRVVAAIMALSAVVACGVGFSASLPYGLVVALCFLHAVTVAGESGSVTAGVVAAAEPGLSGATMAVHSGLGFVGATLGPLAIGIVLDLAGGGASRLAWGLAFVAMGAGVALGPAALAALGRRRAP